MPCFTNCSERLNVWILSAYTLTDVLRFYKILLVFLFFFPPENTLLYFQNRIPTQLDDVIVDHPTKFALYKPLDDYASEVFVDDISNIRYKNEPRCGKPRLMPYATTKAQLSLRIRTIVQYLCLLNPKVQALASLCS